MTNVRLLLKKKKTASQSTRPGARPKESARSGAPSLAETARPAVRTPALEPDRLLGPTEAASAP